MPNIVSLVLGSALLLLASACGPAGDSALPEADVVAQVSPSVIQVIATNEDDVSYGSGVKIQEGILTNAHVVAGAKSIAVLVDGTRRVDARLISTDEKHDLALISAAVEIPALGIESARSQRTGDVVLALGYPLPVEFGSHVHVSATRGLLSRIYDDPQRGPLVQTDAALNPGNSGGALVNMRGNLIGITAGKLTPKGGQGINFAVASESVQSFVAKTAPATQVPGAAANNRPSSVATNAPLPVIRPTPAGSDLSSMRLVGEHIDGGICYLEGGAIIAAPVAGWLRYWEAASGAADGRTTAVSASGSLTCTPDGNVLATRGFSSEHLDYNATNTATGRPVSPGGDVTITDADVFTGGPLSVSADGRFAVAQLTYWGKVNPDGSRKGESNRLVLWNLQTGDTTRITGPVRGILNNALSADGHLIASSSAMDGDPMLTIWDAASGTILRNILLADVPIEVVFTAASDTVAASLRGGSVVLVDADTGHVTCTLPTHENSYITGLTFSRDGTLVAATESGQKTEGITAWVWDARTGDVRHRFGLAEDGSDPVISPDNTQLAMRVGAQSGRGTGDAIALWHL